jgi:hypothetical protein
MIARLHRSTWRFELQEHQASLGLLWTSQRSHTESNKLENNVIRGTHPKFRDDNTGNCPKLSTLAGNILLQRLNVLIITNLGTEAGQGSRKHKRHRREDKINQHTSSSTATLASSTNLVGGRSNRMLSANHSHTNGAAPMEMEGMACKQRHDTPEDQQHNDNRQRGSHLVRHLRSGTVRKLQHRHILQSREEKQHLEEQW